MNMEHILFYGISIFVFLILARILNQFVMRSNLKDMLIDKDNFAVGIQLSGFIVAVLIIIFAVLIGEGHDSLMLNIMWVSIYGVFGLVFLIFISEFLLKIFLKGDCVKSTKGGNIAAGIVLASSYISTALILAGVISGEDSPNGSFVTSIVFLIIGLATLIIFTSLFRVLTSYKDSEQIMNGNIAAALSYAGLMIAISLVIRDSTMGTFVDYSTSLIAYAKSLLLVLFLYPFRQFILQGIILGGGFSFYGGRLDKEIAQDRNLNVGLIEGITYVSVSIFAISFL